MDNIKAYFNFPYTNDPRAKTKNISDWAHSHSFKCEQYDGEWSGWVRGKKKSAVKSYRLIKCRCMSKKNHRFWWKLNGGLSTSILFILHNPPGLSDPFALLTPLRPPTGPRSVHSSYVPCSAQTSAYPKWFWCFPEITGCLGPSSNSGIDLDVLL